jgi:hypothetical protein
MKVRLSDWSAVASPTLHPSKNPVHSEEGLTLSRTRAVAFAIIVVGMGCTQQLVWPADPLHVVIDNGPDDGGVPVRLVGSKSGDLTPVLPVEDAHRIDSGCTRQFPFRSFAWGPMSEKRPVFSFAARDGFVYHLELIPPDGGPTPQLQFFDGDTRIPTPSDGTRFTNGLTVRTTGPGTIYLRVSTCGF